MLTDIQILKYKDARQAEDCHNAVINTLPMLGVGEDEDFDFHLFDNTHENLNIHKIWNDFWKRSQAKYICYLSQDTYPTAGWLDSFVDFMETTPDWWAVCGPSTNNCYNEQSGREEVVVKRGMGVVPGVMLAGFCMFFRRSALETMGGFREDYTFYGGEIDLMYRLRMAGYETAWVVPAFVYHEWGTQTKAMGEEWYNAQREEGNKRLVECIEIYKRRPGLWKANGAACEWTAPRIGW